MKKINTKINLDILAFAMGITIFMIFAMWFLGCSSPGPSPNPVDWAAHNDSVLSAVNDSVDSLTNIEVQMKAKAVFDSLKVN